MGKTRIVGSDEFAKLICPILGLDYGSLNRLTIDLAPNEPVFITVRQVLSEGDGVELVKTFELYTAQEVQE